MCILYTIVHLNSSSSFKFVSLSLLLEEAVRTSDFIFEAVPEDLALKQDLFEWISQCCKIDAVIATNSMTLSIDSIAERASNKARCLGVRYLYPVYCIPEVEIVPGSQTALATLEKVRKFLGRMGKVAFFRSGTEPLVLTSKQREAKKLNLSKIYARVKEMCKKYLRPFLILPISRYCQKGQNLILRSPLEGRRIVLYAWMKKETVYCIPVIICAHAPHVAAYF
ncbi:l-carnitine dehydrogenase [Caerostris extrusa]|uniref:L-carnitine dehydrogenase n=1 Tax=Caerostris extrusa TaxID=172846 RepID=A0AAV4MR46_CAEEX|nr:l-carnitine dehydrogenase [Caerostris extrusa]